MLQLPDRTRPDQICAPAVSTGNFATDLRLIHRLRSGKSARIRE